MPGPLIADFYNAFMTNIKKNNIAAVNKSISDFKKIPNKRFDFNDQDMYGKTLAHYLIEFFNEQLSTMDADYAVEVLDKFLNIGIDLNMKDINGKTAIDLCSRAASHSTILGKLNQYKQTTNFVAPNKSLLDRMAIEPSNVIVGTIDGRYNRSFLMNYPNIYECHCTKYLSRESEGDCRKEFEEETLKYLKDLPGENEITVVGSGHLLDTLALIAKFKKINPNASLRLNLIDHGYIQNSGEKAKELFEDFARCMKDNNIKMSVTSNQTDFVIPNVDVANPGLNLTISVQNNFNQYLALQRKPKLLVGVDLDYGKYNKQQHPIVCDLAKQTNALAYISVSDVSLSKEILIAPQPQPQPQPGAAAAALAAPAIPIPAAVPVATAAPAPFLSVGAMGMGAAPKPAADSEIKAGSDANKSKPKSNPAGGG